MAKENKTKTSQASDNTSVQKKNAKTSKKSDKKTNKTNQKSVTKSKQRSNTKNASQVNKKVNKKSADSKAVKSENVTVDGEELVCETYELKDGTVSEYYFKDGKWVMLSVTKDGETTTQKVLEFKKGVDDSKFSLKGLIEIEQK